MQIQFILWPNQLSINRCLYILINISSPFDINPSPSKPMYIKRSALGRFQPLYGSVNSRQSYDGSSNIVQISTYGIKLSPASGVTHDSEIKASKLQLLASTTYKDQQNGLSPSQLSKDEPDEKYSFTSYTNEDKQNHQPNKGSIVNSQEKKHPEKSFLKNYQKLSPEWELTRIEIKKSFDFFEDLTAEDPQITKWSQKFAEYDSDEDKENIPCSDEEISWSESEGEYGFEQDQAEDMISLKQRNPIIEKFEGELEKIEEVDEQTNSRYSFTTPIKGLRCPKEEKY